MLGSCESFTVAGMESTRGQRRVGGPEALFRKPGLQHLKKSLLMHNTSWTPWETGMGILH